MYRIAQIASKRNHTRMSATLDERFLTPREAAKLLRISQRTVYELVKEGRLPAFRVGGQLRLSVTVLEEWLARNATTTQEL